MKKKFYKSVGYWPLISLCGRHIFFASFSILVSVSMAMAQRLTDPALNFVIFAKENVTLIGTEVEGRVAVGGNLLLGGSNSYQIVPKTNDGFKVHGVPIGLAVRGGVTLPVGKELNINQHNYVKIGNASSPNSLKVNYQAGDFSVVYTNQANGGKIRINSNPNQWGSPPVSASNNPVIENVFGVGPGKFNIDAAFTRFEHISDSLGALTNNVTIGNFDNRGAPPKSAPFNPADFQNVKPLIFLNPNAVNILNITAELWGSFNEIRFEGFSDNAGFSLIINIEGANNKQVIFANSPELQNYEGRVLFNFPGANGWVKLKPGAQIKGVILAPRADVKKMSGANLVGQIISRAFEHDGDEIHYRPYIPLKECSEETFMSGKVFDARDNSPLSFVPISLVPQFENADTLRLYTNSNGQYRFHGVKPGSYLVQVQDENLIVNKNLFPVVSSLHFTTLENCEPREHDFAYNTSMKPSIGDFVWLDINRDNLQNEWYDANGDNKITELTIDVENFQTINYDTWEWVDINGNGTWAEEGDEGELNKAGIKGSPPQQNIKVTGPSGYEKWVIIGVDGYWRDRPYLGDWDDPNSGLFGDFQADLIIDESFENTTLELAATGKVKVFDQNGNAVSTSGRIGVQRATTRNARTSTMEIVTPNGLSANGGVTPPAPVNNTLDIGIAVQDNTLPVSLVSFNAVWIDGEKRGELSWVTSEEVNSSGFEVEHRTSASDWSKLGFVAAGAPPLNGLRTYRLPHFNVPDGINYYRLKHLDQDGSFDYSMIRTLVAEGGTALTVHPNPVVDRLIIKTRASTTEISEMALYDAVGRVVKRSSTYQPVWEVADLATGIYLLTIRYADGGYERFKVLKQ